MIDVGLQDSTESGCGTDFRPGHCARCQRTPVEDGDLCSGCRSFLLGDTEHDPRDTVSVNEADMLTFTRRVSIQISVDMEEALDAFRRLSQQIVDACGPAIEEALRFVDKAVQALPPPELDLEHRHRERQLLDRHRRSQRRTNRWPR